MTKNIRRSIVRKIIPLLILICGVMIMVALIASRKKPEKERRPYSGALVEVQVVSRQSRDVPIIGHGTAAPRHEINLTSQISGRVEWVNSEFVSGGTFKQGDTLVRIERIDYELAVQQAQAAVAQAEYSLAITEANAGIARREWEIMRASQQRLSPGSEPLQEAPDALVLHEPQLHQAKAALASANAALNMAKLSLTRTVITAPFACRIKQETVDPGQFITAATQIARIYSVDMVEIEVGLPIDDIAWIKIPGSKAIVRLKLQENVYEWNGVVAADSTLEIHVAANILMLVFICGGLIIGKNIKQEVFPEIELDRVSVIVLYPGASPIEVEDGIVRPIELAVSGVDNIKRIVSNANENVGSVMVEIVEGAHPDQVLNDVKSEVDRIRTFPEEAERPVVSLISNRRQLKN